MRVSVIGTGYVGLVTGVCFADRGLDVTCVDLDERKVADINRGVPPIHETGLPEMLGRTVGQTLRATTDLAAAVRGSEVTFLAVGTPFDGERIDLSQVEAVAGAVGTALREKDEYHVVAVKSTVVPGTTDGLVRTRLEAASGKRAGPDFGLGMNPEFLTEGTAIRDFSEPDRIVLGGIDDRTQDRLERLYASWPDSPRVRTNNATAEMIKYASNAVLATLISFSNEIGNLSAALGGIDAAEVMRGVHLAQYFSMPGGVARAPITSFLWAGCGFGGSCLPKDVQALIAHARAAGRDAPLLDAVMAINRAQPYLFLDLLRTDFPTLEGRRISVLGLAFKEDTDDMRESPAIPIVGALLAEGADVTAYDPVARETARAALPDGRIRFAENLEEAIENAEALLIVTRWSEFSRLPALLESVEHPPLVVDGRRILAPESVRRYAGIGRG